MTQKSEKRHAEISSPPKVLRRFIQAVTSGHGVRIGHKPGPVIIVAGYRTCHTGETKYDQGYN